MTPVYNDVGRRSIYHNVQLFFRSKTDILNVAMFKYVLLKIKETILHRVSEKNIHSYYCL